ncbi:MAG: four helix bundle protein [Bacteroidota bacterium]
MNQEILEKRLMEYARRCLLLGRSLDKLGYKDSKHLAGQIIRSGSHPGIHYGEARAAESRQDYTHKLGVLLKELREAHNTVRIVDMMHYYEDEKLATLIKEGNELVAIFTATVKKLKDNP